MGAGRGLGAMRIGMFAPLLFEVWATGKWFGHLTPSLVQAHPSQHLAFITLTVAIPYLC